MHKKHVPIRTCVSCRTSGDKRGLLRVVRLPDATVIYDKTGKTSGRGAYVCASETCIAQAKKQKKLDRSLKATVTPEVFEELVSAARKVSPVAPEAADAEAAPAERVESGG